MSTNKETVTRCPRHFERWRVGVLSCLTTISLLLSGCGNQEVADGCAKMRTLGGDAEKIEYIKQWTKDKSGDAEFFALFGSAGELSSTSGGVLFDAVDLDWRLLGIRKGFASFSINSPVGLDKTQPVEPIRHIAISEGRNGLVIGISSDFDADVTTKALESKVATKLAEDVVLYCS